MLLKYLLAALLVTGTQGIFLITLPSAEVDKVHGLEETYHKYRIEDAKNLVDLAESLNLTVLVKALEETGLDNIIDHEGKYTLFAPTNEAFKQIPKWAGKIPLKELLKYHVARGLIYSTDIKNDMEVRTILSKRDIRFNIYKNGSLVTASGSPITSVDHKAHNGVLHIIDRVLVHIYERGGTIVKELSRCPEFKTLVKLVGTADLWARLHEKGPFTVFAPTNDAFSTVPADVLKHLIENPDLLRQVLLYHVGVGTWYSAGLEDKSSLQTVHGAKLSIAVSKDGVKVNDKATVIGADGTASNGVIHGIDAVLIPPSLEEKIRRSMKTAKRRRLLKGRNGD